MRLAWLAVVVFGVVIAAADNVSSQTAAESARCRDGRPLQTREANVPDQRPAFAGQTRACALEPSAGFDVVVVAKGLQKPWAVEPLANGEFLITEKPGHLRIVSATGEVGQPIAGVPPVDARGQGGLLDVALSPSFDTDRT